MSKFLNLFGPALGGTVAVLGSAYFLADQLVVDMPAPARGNIVTSAEAQDNGDEPSDDAAATAESGEVSETAAPDEASFEPAESGDLPLGDVRRIDFESGESRGIGREALPEEIAAWNVDVTPDGQGLPEGSGSVAEGERLFSENCAACHGEFAEGAGNWPPLAGGQGTLADEDPVKTVGSYWPYLSTAWDYVHRSMPFGNAQSLETDEIYAIVAYILYSDFIVEDDFVLSHENFLDVEMPNAEGFLIDDRAESEYPQWRSEPCMENCKDEVEITMRASVLDVTPETEGSALSEGQQAAIEQAQARSGTDEEPDTGATDDAAEAEEEADAGEDAAEPSAAPDPELVAAGESVFRRCQSCHEVGEGARNRTGPQLNGIVGSTVGAVEDFRYSNVFQDAHEEGMVWTDENLAAFFENPRSYMSGTRMAFNGLRSEEDIEAVIAYLKSFDE